MGVIRDAWKGGSDTEWKAGNNYSKETELLFDIRRYARAIVAMHVIFVGIIVITFSLVWSQISKYELLKPENVNSINSGLVSILSNAQLMTASGVPIAANLEYATLALSAAVTALYNATSALAVAPAGGRHMLMEDAPPVTESDLLKEDYRMRKMMYSQVHRLLQASNDKLDTFDMGALSDLVSATAVQVGNVNFTGLAQRYDRTLGDLEGTAHFGLVAAGMLGIAAQLTNSSMPTTAQVVGSYSAQLQAAAVASPPPRRA